jgi:NADPH-dependent 2,4-dienoyl-CoA reductase/sulfur reductase-like enzyme
MCQHQPRCPEWDASDRLAARIVADQPGQGWSLLCNGIIVFDAPSVFIVGAGFAGLSAVDGLRKGGYRVTVGWPSAGEH